ncbi:MAG: hypothetical protein A3F26_00545 [Candidatus Ryanbacteria bacterium RIFCSPHIGHO2_12_FULL_47_12b]|nr:MAG: hypothetical protein A3F26_00545 [Candidatus Ryanbacteria bacterium RIFCSPHIGHO2_12_FULL_47_12b]
MHRGTGWKSRSSCATESKIIVIFPLGDAVTNSPFGVRKAWSVAEAEAAPTNPRATKTSKMERKNLMSQSPFSPLERIRGDLMSAFNIPQSEKLCKGARALMIFP